MKELSLNLKVSVQLRRILVLFGVCNLFVSEIELIPHRSKRFLIFPQQSPTRHQFIGGIGIPADLSYETVVISYVLKAEFWLPWNRTVYRENPYFPEYQTDIDINGRRWKRHIQRQQRSHDGLRRFLYKTIIERFNGYGYHGSECLLRAICEANHIEFARDGDFFGQMLHIFFSPSTTEDDFGEQNEILDFKLAEGYGKSLRHANNDKDNSCDRIYDCNVSILELISQIIPIK